MDEEPFGSLSDLWSGSIQEVNALSSDMEEAWHLTLSKLPIVSLESLFQSERCIHVRGSCVEPVLGLEGGTIRGPLGPQFSRKLQWHVPMWGGPLLY